MTPPDDRRVSWPWFVLAGFIAMALVGTVLVAVNDESVASQVPYVIAFSMFGAVGALIVSRDPGNSVGILLLWGCFTTATSYTAGELATWLVERGDIGVTTQLLGLLSSLGWLLGILPVLFLLPLLFPDGRLPSPRWKPFLWWIVAMLFVLLLTLTVGSPTVSTSSDAIELDNPLYVSALGRIAIPDPVFAVLYFGTWAVSVSSVFIRFRRAGGVERQQIKWVAFGFLAAFVATFGSDLLRDETLSAIVGGAGFLAFPISIGVAVLRFRLYDLDVVVKRTVVYAALALFATLVYLTVVVGAGAWLGRENSMLTMIAAVIVAITFQPVRARTAKLADRLVYGKRATPYEVLSEFSERVGGAYADDDLLPRMARVLGEGVGAERADVWLVVEDELRDVATWPPDAGAGRADRGRGRSAARAARAPIGAFPVEHGGELLGVLAVRKPPSDPLSTADERARRRPRGAGAARAPERPADRGAPRASRRPARRAEAPRGGAGPRASPARAQHPRRRAAAARRARREDAAGALADRSRSRRRSSRCSRRSRARRRRRSRTCATSLGASTRRCSPTRGSPPRSRPRRESRRSP